MVLLGRHCWSSHELNLFLHISGSLIATFQLLGIVLGLLVLGCCQLLRVGQVVDGDGQEDVEQGVVAEEGEDDEVKGVDHSGAMATL